MCSVPAGATSQVPRPATTAMMTVDPDDPREAGERDRRAQDDERDRVADQVAEAGVQERRGGDADQAVAVVRLDAVLVEVAAERRVDDLDDPHQPRHRGDEHETVLAVEPALRARGRSRRRHAVKVDGVEDDASRAGWVGDGDPVADPRRGGEPARRRAGPARPGADGADRARAAGRRAWRGRPRVRARGGGGRGGGGDLRADRPRRDRARTARRVAPARGPRARRPRSGAARRAARVPGAPRDVRRGRWPSRCAGPGSSGWCGRTWRCSDAGRPAARRLSAPRRERGAEQRARAGARRARLRA